MQKSTSSLRGALITIARVTVSSTTTTTTNTVYEGVTVQADSLEGDLPVGLPAHLEQAQSLAAAEPSQQDPAPAAAEPPKASPVVAPVVSPRAAPEPSTPTVPVAPAVMKTAEAPVASALVPKSEPAAESTARQETAAEAPVSKPVVAEQPTQAESVPTVSPLVEVGKHTCRVCTGCKVHFVPPSLLCGVDDTTPSLRCTRCEPLTIELMKRMSDTGYCITCTDVKLNGVDVRFFAVNAKTNEGKALQIRLGTAKPAVPTALQPPPAPVKPEPPKANLIAPEDIRIGVADQPLETDGLYRHCREIVMTEGVEGEKPSRKLCGHWFVVLSGINDQATRCLKHCGDALHDRVTRMLTDRGMKMVLGYLRSQDRDRPRSIHAYHVEVVPELFEAIRQTALAKEEAAARTRALTRESRAVEQRQATAAQFRARPEPVAMRKGFAGYAEDDKLEKAVKAVQPPSEKTLQERLVDEFEVNLLAAYNAAGHKIPESMPHFEGNMHLTDPTSSNDISKSLAGIWVIGRLHDRPITKCFWGFFSPEHKAKRDQALAKKREKLQSAATNPTPSRKEEKPVVTGKRGLAALAELKDKLPPGPTAESPEASVTVAVSAESGAAEASLPSNEPTPPLEALHVNNVHHHTESPEASHQAAPEEQPTG